nr:TIGR04104 family putative zinc finger protein [Sporosarcina sp. E16_8]
MLNKDFSKAILFISFFIILRILIKRSLQKSGKGLPVCVECGKEWTYREALKRSMKNREITCPYCNKKQYRTKKSLLKGSVLNILIPFSVIVPQLFDNILLGIVIHITCSGYAMLSLSPYYLELQQKDPINDPLW